MPLVSAWLSPALCLLRPVPCQDVASSDHVFDQRSSNLISPNSLSGNYNKKKPLQSQPHCLCCVCHFTTMIQKSNNHIVKADAITNFSPCFLSSLFTKLSMLRWNCLDWKLKKICWFLSLIKVLKMCAHLVLKSPLSPRIMRVTREPENTSVS